ncbi:TPA: fimbrial protein [Escherichia coli]|nr:fimbrial protein [Escherichia coli]
MKKTLIALAVAASAAVSGSAMAWTANGTGGSVDLGGTLTPIEKVTPWEVEVGAAVNGLNGSIQKGATTVEIPVGKNIPVLAIRNNAVFNGQPGIVPVINYGGAINTANFTDNTTALTLNVNGDAGRIGVLTAPLYASAIEKVAWGNNVDVKYLAASQPTGAFAGGVPTSVDAVTISGAYEAMAQLFSDIWKNEIPEAGTSWVKGDNESFADPSVKYSASYASGIRDFAKITIKLDAPAANDSINWSAQLPVTVSYQ